MAELWIACKILYLALSTLLKLVELPAVPTNISVSSMGRNATAATPLVLVLLSRLAGLMSAEMAAPWPVQAT